MPDAMRIRQRSALFSVDIGDKKDQFGFIKIADGGTRDPLMRRASWAAGIVDLHNRWYALAKPG